MKKIFLSVLMLCSTSVFAADLDSNRYHIEFGGKTKHTLNLYFGETTDTVEVSNMTVKDVADIDGSNVLTRQIEVGEQLKVKHVGGPEKPFEVTLKQVSMLGDSGTQDVTLTPVLTLNKKVTVKVNGENYSLVVRPGFAK